MHEVFIFDNYVFEEEIVMEEAVRYRIRELMSEGIYDANDLFEVIYPTYNGHYAKLREIIAEEKNYA